MKYLYNGIKLPKLPEYDKAAYPNAYIVHWAGNLYSLILLPDGWSYVYNTQGNTGVNNYISAYGVTGIYYDAAGSASENASKEWELNAASIENPVIYSEAITPVWSNFDIIAEDESVYLAASDPVPAWDARSFWMGVSLGLAGKGLPSTVQPTAYLYNGVKLPALPEWDREMYPYAAVTRTRSGGIRNLVLSPSPLVVEIRLGYGTTDDYFGVLCDDGVTKKIYGLTTDGTAWEYRFDSIPSVGKPFAEYVVDWSNADVCGADGTLLLSASNPVPVYE